MLWHYPAGAVSGQSTEKQLSETLIENESDQNTEYTRTYKVQTD